MGHAASVPGHAADGLRTPHRRWAFGQCSCGMENTDISTPLTTAAWGHAVQAGAALSYKAVEFSFYSLTQYSHIHCSAGISLQWVCPSPPRHIQATNAEP